MPHQPDHQPTRRERIATGVLATLLQNYAVAGLTPEGEQRATQIGLVATLAEGAVRYADALIVALEQVPPERRK